MITPARLTAAAALVFMAIQPASATFFPGPSGSCCNQFGGGGSYVPPPNPAAVACYRTNIAKYGINNMLIILQRCRRLRGSPSLASPPLPSRWLSC